MTLSISYFEEDKKSNQLEYLGMPEKPGSELFGFESWRTNVWGKISNTKYLSKLATTDIYIFTNELEGFEKELLIALSKTLGYSKEFNIDKEDLEYRLNNAISAARYAKDKGWGLCIS